MSNITNFKFKGPLYEIIGNTEGRVLTTKNTNLKASTSYVEIDTKDRKNELLSNSILDFKLDGENNENINTVAKIPYVIPNFYVKNINTPVIYSEENIANTDNYYSFSRDENSNYIASYGLTITPIAYSTIWYSGNDLIYDTITKQTKKQVDETINGNIIKAYKVNTANLGDMYINNLGQVFRCYQGYGNYISDNSAIARNESDILTIEKNFYLPDNVTKQNIAAGDTIFYIVNIINNIDEDITNIALSDDKCTIPPDNNTNFDPDDFSINGNDHITIEYSYTITADDIQAEEITNTAEITYQYDDETITSAVELTINLNEISVNEQAALWEYIVTIKGKNGTNSTWYHGQQLKYENNTVIISNEISAINEVTSDIVEGTIGDMYLNDEGDVFSCIKNGILQDITKVSQKWEYASSIRGLSSDQFNVWNGLNLTATYEEKDQQDQLIWVDEIDEQNNTKNYFVSDVKKIVRTGQSQPSLTVYHKAFENQDKIIPAEAIYGTSKNESLDTYIANNTTLRDLINDLIVIDANEPNSANTKLWIKVSTLQGGNNGPGGINVPS